MNIFNTFWDSLFLNNKNRILSNLLICGYLLRALENCWNVALQPSVLAPSTAGTGDLLLGSL